MQRRLTVWTAVLFLMLLGVHSESSSQGRRSVANKLAVRQIEMGYRLGEPTLRVRLHLESGQAIEHELPQGTDTEYFVALTRIVGSRGGRMFAEVADNELVSFQIAVP